jgi:hypothetical protein
MVGFHCFVNFIKKKKKKEGKKKTRKGQATKKSRKRRPKYFYTNEIKAIVS